MSEVRWSRRVVLSTTALAGVAAAVTAASGGAWALRVEDDAAAERLYLSACETRAAHDQLAQDLMAQLEGQEGRARAAEIVRDTACPVCGCKLGVAAGPTDGSG
jgi:hypothetical protein